MTACGEPAEETRAPHAEGEGPTPAAAAPERPDARTDTIRVEGMPEPISLRLYRAPDDFPLPFTAYVPDDMAPSAGDDESTAHFTAELGGVRNDDAFLHLYVFPEATEPQHAIAAAKAYKAGRGIPVSRGIELISDELRPPHLEWAIEAHRFRYQAGGEWFGGTVGVGRHQDRYFLLMRHYPVEYGDGFAPRADLITGTWRWADGSGLESGPRPEPPPVVEGVQDGEG